MLPSAAQTHFQHLVAERISEVTRNLDADVKAFNRKEPAGRGAGHVARLAGVYARQLQPLRLGIFDALCEVHARFDLGLSDDVQSDFLRLADESYQGWVRGMEGAFSRHLGRFGLPDSPLDWGLVVAATQAGLSNSVRRYFLNLKNLPPMKQEAVSNTTININAPVNVVQTGAGSVAHVHAGWAPADVAAAVHALDQLRDAMKADPSVSEGLLVELVNDVENIAQEVQSSSPRGASITRWLGGLGASVQTVASLQPAWQAVQAAMKLLGL